MLTEQEGTGLEQMIPVKGGRTLLLVHFEPPRLSWRPVSVSQAGIT